MDCTCGQTPCRRWRELSGHCPGARDSKPCDHCLNVPAFCAVLLDEQPESHTAGCHATPWLDCHCDVEGMWAYACEPCLLGLLGAVDQLVVRSL